MAQEEYLAKLMLGVEAWNQWRGNNPKLVPDLRQSASERPGAASLLVRAIWRSCLSQILGSRCMF